MRVVSASVKNFGSYKELDLEFNNQGLTLISGITGAGKSTICDIVPWALFGKTAKDGAVDEIISWGAKSKTFVELIIEINGKTYKICRQRGNKENDLWIEDQGVKIRGSDLNDTQEKINELTGVLPQVFLSSVYYHDFSPLAGFFTANAKSRKQLMEQIADLKLSIILQKSLSEHTKGLKKEQEEALVEIRMARAKLRGLQQSQDRLKSQEQKWLKERQDYLDKVGSKQVRKEKLLVKIKDLEDKILRVDAEYALRAEEQKNLINSFELKQCDSCGQDLNSANKLTLTKKLNSILLQQGCEIQVLETPLNKLKGELQALERPLNEPEQTNPYDKTLFENAIEIREKEETIARFQNTIDDMFKDVYKFELLQSVNAEFRKKQLELTVLQLQNATNDLLTEYFDAELQVKFTAETNDSLEIDLLKDGNKCTFTQLSKGQKQLLRLCFVIAGMKTMANYNSLKSNVVFFDEIFSGCDDDLKVKAFKLIQTIASQYESTFVIDHSEALKSMFDNKIQVLMQNGYSLTEKA